jgi:hypothetical protein
VPFCRIKIVINFIVPKHKIFVSQVGSSSKLSFSKQNLQVKPSANVAAVWKLDDTVDDDIETVDENDLLDEEDLKKPDPSSLRGLFLVETFTVVTVGFVSKLGDVRLYLCLLL